MHSCSGRGTERKSVPSGEAAAPALLSSDPREATRAALPEGHPPFLLFLHAIECFLCCAKLLPLVSSRWSVFALSLVFRCHTQRLVTKTSAGSSGSSVLQPPDGPRSYGEAFNPRRCAVRVWCERRVRFHSPARGRFPSMYWRDSPFPIVVSLDWGKRTPSRRQSLVRVKQTCAHSNGGVSKWHRSCRGERTLGDPNWGDPNSKIIKYHWIITQSEK